MRSIAIKVLLGIDYLALAYMICITITYFLQLGFAAKELKNYVKIPALFRLSQVH